jgi:hypothetical protein
MNPHQYTNFNSYIKNLRVLVFITDRDINPGGGLGNYVPPG